VGIESTGSASLLLTSDTAGWATAECVSSTRMMSPKMRSLSLSPSVARLQVRSPDSGTNSSMKRKVAWISVFVPWINVVERDVSGSILWVA